VRVANGGRFLLAATFAFFVSFESKKAASFERSCESTILLYLTNNAQYLTAYREHDLFLVFRIVKAFAEDWFALLRGPQNQSSTTFFSRMALMDDNDRKRERERESDVYREIFSLLRAASEAFIPPTLRVHRERNHVK